MPAEYNPFADLEAYGADLKARRGAAAATSAQADQAALKFGLQNLEGNQAMSKQRLVNQGDETKARITGSYSQGIHPDTPLMKAMQMMVMAKRANTVKDTMDAAHAGAQAGLMMPMGGELEQPQDWLEQGLTQGRPTAEKAASAYNQQTVGAENSDEFEGVTAGPGGPQIGPFGVSKTKRTNTDSAVSRGGPANTVVPPKINGSAKPNQQPAPKSNTPDPKIINGLKYGIQQGVSKGLLSPDAKPTGEIDEKGRYKVVSEKGVGWVKIH